jgi:hypothetical protein
MTRLLWLLTFACAGFAQGATFLEDYSNPTNGTALSAGFIPDASRIIVGEPVFLTFSISNRAAQPFQFSHVRNEIFTVAATNAAGAPVKSRYFGLDGNGFMRQEVVPPGKTYTSRIFLNERCVFDQPGDYTVTGQCDFGFFSNRSNAIARPVVTTFKLTVLPADSRRLTEIIQSWGKAVETNGPLVEAAQALAEINDPRTIAPLAALVAKDAGNYLAVNALARFTNDAAADALIIVARQGPDYIAEMAGKALQKSHQHDRAARTLLPMLTNADPNLRIQGAHAVSRTGSELAFAPLCALLQDATNAVRYAAAEAVGRVGHPQSFATLTNLLADADYVLRLAAVKGLRALGRPLQAAWLQPMILSGGENIRTWYDAMDMLRMYGGDQAARGLAQCVHFDDPSVKSGYNFRLISAIEFSPNGPKHYYQWHHDPNRDGTPEELADNRKILSELKAWLDRQK